MRALFGVAALIAFGLGACSASDDGNEVAQGGGGGVAGSGGGSGGGAKSCTKDGDCFQGRYCSVTMSCVAAGQCGADGDCAPPKFCGQGSSTCLEPGACVTDQDCAAEQTCDTQAKVCKAADGCGQIEFTLTQLPPNVMILLDRSGSMSSGAGGDSRWNVAKNAIQTVTTTFDTQIRFGLATYSSCLLPGCSAGSIVVPIADSNAVNINGFLGNTIDQGSQNGQAVVGGKVQYLCDSGLPETSTGKSLSALVGEPSLADPLRTNAVILLTDGEESSSCVAGCGGPCGAQSLVLQTPSVRTFVIGLGVNSSAIDTIALAGGTTQALPANNQAELNNAFNQIAAAVATCEFVLNNAPADADKLYVHFNDNPAQIPADPNNGWSFDPTTNKLVFHGAACDDIKSGKVTDIDVVYGCPGPVVR